MSNKSVSEFAIFPFSLTRHEGDEKNSLLFITQYVLFVIIVLLINKKHVSGKNSKKRFIKTQILYHLALVLSRLLRID